MTYRHTPKCVVYKPKPPANFMLQECHCTDFHYILLPLCKQGPQPLKVSRKGSNLDLLFLPRILCNQLINLECYSTNNTVLVVANINNRN